MPESESNIPLRFKWGTFCKNVLKNEGVESEKSLIGIMHRIKIAIPSLQVLQANEADKVELFPVNFGNVWVYMLFERSFPSDTTSFKLTPVCNLPNQKSDNGGDFLVEFNSEYENWQFVLQMEPMVMAIPAKLGIYSQDVVWELRDEQKRVVGRVVLPVEITVC